MNPFFSIVTEVYNRQSTIARTINSIFSQSFLDFEYIIVEFNSNDESVSVIEEELSKNKKNNVKFIKHIHANNEIERWNYPLKFANGRYIVVLEGDDWFEKDYLKFAYEKLANSYNIGIYISQRLGYKPKFSGRVKNEIIIREFFQLNFVPPPSEAIFIRTNSDFRPFNYDSENYCWAAEYSLYREILLDGFDVFYEFDIGNNYVHRGISPRKHSIKHVIDMFTIAEFNKSLMHKNENLIVESKIAKQLGKTFAMQLLQFNFEIELFKLFLKHTFRSPITLIFFLQEFKKSIINSLFFGLSKVKKMLIFFDIRYER